MTRKCFLAMAWSIDEDATRIQGPYDDFETAEHALEEFALGDIDGNAAVIGPLPFTQVISMGKWGDGEDTNLDKSIARQWAVFEAPDGDVQWITFGDESDLKEDYNFHWIGNYEGDTPAEAYAVANENGGPKEGYRFVAVPVGVFGPIDWMRIAGDMLTKIKG